LTINHISKSGFDILRFKPEILQLPKTQIFINLWLDDELNTLDVEQKFIEKFICGQYTFHHGLVIRRYFGDFGKFFAKILEVGFFFEKVLNTNFTGIQKIRAS
jgi:hypothetical protein